MAGPGTALPFFCNHALYFPGSGADEEEPFHFGGKQIGFCPEVFQHLVGDLLEASVPQAATFPVVGEEGIFVGGEGPLVGRVIYRVGKMENPDVFPELRRDFRRGRKPGERLVLDGLADDSSSTFRVPRPILHGPH